jgi:MprA protease rhombosortase-interaction domain-containing protein
MVNVHARLLVAGLLVGSGTLHGAMLETPVIRDGASGSMAQALPAHGDVATAGRLLPGNLPAQAGQAIGSGRTALLRVTDANAASGNPIGSDIASEKPPREPVASGAGIRSDDALQAPGAWTLLLLAAGLVGYQLRRQSKSNRGIRF